MPGNFSLLALRLQKALEKSLRLITEGSFLKGPIPDNFCLKIGINTGSLVGGVISTTLPRYKLIGDTVDTASRMKSTCPPYGIQISKKASEFLDSSFQIQSRGFLDVKGKGKMEPFLVLSGPNEIRIGKQKQKGSLNLNSFKHACRTSSVLFKGFYNMLAPDQV